MSNTPKEIPSMREPYSTFSSKHPPRPPRNLSQAVRRGDIHNVLLFLAQPDCDIQSISPTCLATFPSTALFEIIIAQNGWPINQTDPDLGDGPGQSLIQLICGDELLVQWCISHGAQVRGLHTDPFKSPPLLEIVARSSTVSTFKLLQACGAEPGIRMLHRAAGAAVRDTDEDRLSARLEMVRYLVEELGLDPNSADCATPMPNHWGTPLCYAACNNWGGEEVVRYLIERGADPRVKDCWELRDAFGCARASGNEGILQVLDEWKKRMDEI